MRAAAALDREWAAPIITQLLKHDGLEFDDLKHELNGISHAVLSDTLDDLEQAGLVMRSQFVEVMKQVYKGIIYHHK